MKKKLMANDNKAKDRYQYKVAVFVSYELMFLTFVLAQSIDVLHET